MTEKVPEQIHCPKCAHQQTNPVECEACGLLFRKFERVRDRKKEALAEQNADQPKSGGLVLRIASALVLA